MKEKNSNSYIFHGTLIRREMGCVVVESETPEQAKEALKTGEWIELDAHCGETDFEWDGREPAGF